MDFGKKTHRKQQTRRKERFFGRSIRHLSSCSPSSNALHSSSDQSDMVSASGTALILRRLWASSQSLPHCCSRWRARSSSRVCAPVGRPETPPVDEEEEGGGGAAVPVTAPPAASASAALAR